MKKICVLGMILMVFFLFSCEKDSIKIGFVATLSGGNADIGISIRDSMLMKVNEVNEDGGIDGRKIEIILRDDKNDPELIKKYNQELLDMGVDLFYGYELSSKYVHITDLISKDVIVMSPTLSSTLASGIDDNFFRTISASDEQGLTIAKYAEGKSHKTLIVYDQKNISYAQGVIKGYRDHFIGEISELPIVDQPHDYEEQLLEEYKGHDSILLIMNPNDCATIAQLLYRNKITTQIYSSAWGMVSDGYKSAGKAMEGAVFSSHIGDDTLPNYIKYVENYRKYYNDDPIFASVYSYEAFTLYVEALKNTKSLKVADIKKSLLDLTSIQGIISTLEFDAYGDIERENYLAYIVDGELIIMK